MWQHGIISELSRRSQFKKWGGGGGRGEGVVQDLPEGAGKKGGEVHTGTDMDRGGMLLGWAEAPHGKRLQNIPRGAGRGKGVGTSGSMVELLHPLVGFQ